MNTITPFKGLELIVTVDDVENIRYLLDPNGEGLRLICDVCDGKSFEVKTLIEASLDLSVSRRHGQAILRDHEVDSVSALKVIRCGTCGSEDFVREKPKGNENEEGSNSTG